MTTKEMIAAKFGEYQDNEKKFSEKGIKAASTRARVAVADLMELCKQRRAEIVEERAKEEEGGKKD